MKITGIEIGKLDIFDCEDAGKYEREMAKMVKLAKEIKGLKTSEVIRRQCEGINVCFNALFGEGTSNKLFGDTLNIKKSLLAFVELKEAISDQEKELEKLLPKDIMSKIKK